jgi:hypothetical protein
MALGRQEDSTGSSKAENSTGKKVDNSMARAFKYKVAQKIKQMNESAEQKGRTTGDTSMARAFRAKIAKIQAEEASKLSILDLTPQESAYPNDKLSPRSKLKANFKKSMDERKKS